MGVHPSARSTARRIARFEFPPTQIGGCGDCTGRGSIVCPRTSKCRPVSCTPLSVHARAHRDERLVEQLVALVEVDAEGAELGLQVAGAHAERQPPAGQHVEAHRRLRGEERVAVRDDAEVGEQPHGGGRAAAANDERDERVERVVAAGGEPLVFGVRVLGDEHAVNPASSAARAHDGDRVGADELVARVDAVRREPDVELHTRPASDR